MASHVGYLEEGRLRFSEDMAALVARFREVELTFDSAPPIQEKWPESWMQVASAGVVLRFVESRFDKERTETQIRKLFPRVRDVTLTPMSLRGIFVAMAKSGRSSAGGSAP